MVLSVALLIVLEGLWLYRSYEKEFFDFRRDTNFLLRTAVSEIRDSVLVRNIRPVDGDSIKEIRVERFIDTVKMVISRKDTRDHPTPDTGMKQKVRVFISSTTDTIQSDVLAPLAARIHQLKESRDATRGYIIQLTDDTLDIEILKRKYERSLAQVNIPMNASVELLPAAPVDEHPGPFKRTAQLRRGGKEKPEILFANTVRTDPAVYNPLSHYAASFTGVRSHLLKRIAPEISFSIFLTLMTSGAFWLVYSNMLKQQRLVQVKDDFISNVTHELKTPVATVSVALEAIKNFSAMNDPVLTREYLDIAQRELGRLTSITDNILKTSVLEQKPVLEASEVVDLLEIAEDVYAAMKLMGASSNALVSFEAEGNDFRVRGSREHLSGALYNLAENALKYRSEDPHLDIRLSETNKSVIVAVRDNGPGIESAYHEKIFEKFFRVPQGNIHTIKGYGLGLNYVRTVVDLHHGTVQVVSALGKGSEFKLSFPKATASDV
jgi:two-component system, OmpR family, phosphate regulon sensor histidine kinase PhoR